MLLMNIWKNTVRIFGGHAWVKAFRVSCPDTVVSGTNWHIGSISTRKKTSIFSFPWLPHMDYANIFRWSIFFRKWLLNRKLHKSLKCISELSLNALQNFLCITILTWHVIQREKWECLFLSHDTLTTLNSVSVSQYCLIPGLLVLNKAFHWSAVGFW